MRLRNLDGDYLSGSVSGALLTSRSNCKSEPQSVLLVKCCSEPHYVAMSKMLPFLGKETSPADHTCFLLVVSERENERERESAFKVEAAACL